MTTTPPLPADFAYRVRPGRPAEHRAGRMLLPAAYRMATPTLLVAVTGGPEQVIAAAALLPWPLGRVRGLALDVHVAAPFRRRGIGAQLVAAAAEEIRRRGLLALHAIAPVDSGSPEEAAWLALGFTSRIGIGHYEAESARLVAVLEPTYARLIRRDRIPADAVAVPLRAVADRQTLVPLYTQCLGGLPQVILRRLQGQGPDAFCPDTSHALLVGGRPAGVVLARILEPGLVYVDAIMVSPEFRFGWAHALLKLHAARNALAHRRRRFRFTAYDHHRDTRRVAERCGACLLKATWQLYREIGCAA